MQNRYQPLILAGIMAFAAAAEAETVIYGRLHSSQAYSNPDSAGGNGARFGLKGSDEQGSGLKALFELEWQVDTGDLLTSRSQRLENRPGYLDQDWGTTSLGRLGTPHYSSTNKIDIWDLSIDYQRGPHTIGTSFLNYQEDDGLDNRELWGAATRYRFSDFALTAQYEYDREREFEKSQEWTFAGEYYLGNNILRATYSDRDWDGGTDPHWSFGLKHQVNKRTSFYAEFQDNDTTAKQLFGAGIRLGF